MDWGRPISGVGSSGLAFSGVANKGLPNSGVAAVGFPEDLPGDGLPYAELLVFEPEDGRLMDGDQPEKFRLALPLTPRPLWATDSLQNHKQVKIDAIRQKLIFVNSDMVIF